MFETASICLQVAIQSAPNLTINTFDPAVQVAVAVQQIPPRAI
jgi:hypothetical protein